MARRIFVSCATHSSVLLFLSTLFLLTFEIKAFVPQASFGTIKKEYRFQQQEASFDKQKKTTRWLSEQEKETESVVSSSSKLKDAMDEANDALTAVGWAKPLEDKEFTSDDPFVKSIDESIQQEMGVGLDQLLNPAKVVNLERDLYNLRRELATLTNLQDEPSSSSATTSDWDGGEGGPEAEKVRSRIAKKEKDLALERRSVFRGWLKNVFLVQAILSLFLSLVLCTQPELLFGNFGWFQSYNMDVSMKVLGFWWWWLFIVPSLRSRRPSGAEKKALDIAFLGTPLVSLLAPVATKNTLAIWSLNFMVVVGAYAFSYLAPDSDDDGNDETKQQPDWLKFVMKSLDFGVGKERGIRK